MNKINLVESEAGKIDKKWLGHVLIFPGGGYQHLSPREAEPVARAYAAAGWKPWILYYSVRESEREPLLKTTVLKEAAEAVLRIRRAYPGEFLAVCGFSAGAHAAGTLGVHWNDTALAEGKEERELRPDAMILCYPVITTGEFSHRGSINMLIGEAPGEEIEAEEWKSLHEYFSLEKQVGEDTPPCFLWHTAADHSVPVENSLLFAEALSRNRVPYELHIYPFGAHGLSLATEEVSEREKDRFPDPHVQSWFKDCIEWLGISDTKYVTKNGKEVGRFVPKDEAVSYLTDSLTGILKGNYDLDDVREERLTEKYEGID